MQPEYELTLHPMDLRRHGLNPYGKPMYRVVWADSRKTRVWRAGTMYTLPRYVHGEEAECAGHWVLEKWAGAETIWGMTREQYDTMLAALPHMAREPWPETGDYEFSYLFDAGVDEAFVHKQIEMHEYVRAHKTMNDRMVDAVKEEDAKEKSLDEAFENKYEEVREEVLCQ